jgi:hypothetical protein
MLDSFDMTDRVRRLQQLALGSRWSVADAIPWQALSFQRVAPRVRAAMGSIYADVLYAEAFGLDGILRLAELAPEGPLRDFARTHVEDETRHVELFRRVVGVLGTEPTISPALIELRAEVEAARSYDELLLCAQMVEIAAQMVFIGSAKHGLSLSQRAVRLPGSESIRALLQAIVTHVARDESRHLAFGSSYLRARIRELPVAERARLSAFAAGLCDKSERAFAALGPAYGALGASIDELLARGRAEQRRTLESLHLELT